MDNQANQNQVQPPPPRDEEEDEDPSKMEEEELIAKVNKLMDKITSSPDNPKPNVLHALASILETQETRYVLTIFFNIFANFSVLIFEFSVLTFS